MNQLRRCLDAMPLVAILRGMDPEEAPAAFDALTGAGIRIIEVPLNRPGAFESLRILVRCAGDDILIGAGTVLSAEEAEAVADAGARLMVAPNCDPAVIETARALGLQTMPGVATPSEALAALKAGADALKLFPAEMLPPKILTAWRAVLSPECLLVPVGGIRPESIADYARAGASGFGIGSALFQPKIAPAELAGRAESFVRCCRGHFNIR